MKKLLTRGMAYLLAVLMALALLPAASLAEEDTGETATAVTSTDGQPGEGQADGKDADTQTSQDDAGSPAGEDAEEDAAGETAAQDNDAQDTETSGAEPQEADTEATDADLTDSDAVDGGTIGGISWAIDEDDVLTVSGTGAIPSFTSTTPPWCNADLGYNYSVSAIVVEEGITAIGAYAFSYMEGAGSVTLPDTLETIGSYAFAAMASLGTITIPQNVSSIGEGAFAYCDRLSAISVAEGNGTYETDGIALYTTDGGTLLCYPSGRTASSYTVKDGTLEIAPYAFLGGGQTDGLTQDYLTSVTLPDSVETIRHDAFAYCAVLTEINLPEGLYTIGEDAFLGCYELPEVTIPSTVFSIGAEAFSACYSLSAIHVAAGNESYKDIDGVLYTADGSTLVLFPAMAGSTCTVAKGTKKIAAYAFSWCTDLTEVTLPDGLTTIGSYAYSWCMALKHLTLPATVTSLGTGCFYESGLTALTVPSGVTEIPASMCENCFTLAEVILPTGITGIGERAFYDCDKLTAISLPSTLTRIEKEAFYSCGKLESLLVPASVTRICAYAFENCRSLHEVEFRGNTTLDASALANCAGITRLTLPCTLKYASTAFSGCTGITYVSITAGTTGTMISYKASESGTYGYKSTPWYIARASLTTVSIEEGVKNISAYAFYQNTALATITIPSTCTAIADSAFDGDTALADIWYAGTAAKWDGMAIGIGNDALDSARLHCGHVHQYEVVETDRSVAPTCLVDGLAVYRCSCGEGYDEVLPATGHDAVLVEGMPASCVQDGYESYWYCTNCGRAFRDEACTRLLDMTEPDLVPNGHTLTHVAGVDPTCTTAGQREYWHCSVCDGYYLREACDEAVDADALVLPALGHDAVAIPGLAPTCTEAGYAESWQCARCLLLFADAACTEEITAPTTLPATGHTPVTDPAVAPTAFSEGLTEGSHCSGCGEVYVAQETVARLSVTGVKVTVSGTTAKVSWQKTTGAKGYEILRGTSEEGPFTVIKTITSGSAVSFSNTGLTRGNMYYYRVVAYDAAKERSAAGEAASAAIALKAPSVSLKRSGGTVTLTISRVAGAATYTVYRDNGTGETPVAFEPLTITASSIKWKDTTADARGYYRYYVVAESEAGIQATSAVKTTAGTKKAPKLTLKLSGLTTLSVKWAAVSGATGYRLTLKDANGASGSWFYTAEDYEALQGAAVKLTVSPVGTYTVRVETVLDGTEEGELSASTVMAVPATGKVKAGMTAPAVTVKKTAVDTVKLTWKKVVGAMGYEILRSTAKNGTYERVQDGFVEAQNADGSLPASYSFSDVAAPGRTYYYKVVAVFTGETALGTASARKTSGVKAVSLPFAKPTVTLKLTSTDQKAIKVSWKAVSGATSYAVYRSTVKNGTYKPVAEVTALSYQDAGVEKGVTYYYRVTAIRKAVSYEVSADSAVKYLKVK